jgi:hypothetical protein
MYLFMALIIIYFNALILSGATARGHVFGAVIIIETDIRPRN